MIKEIKKVNVKFNNETVGYLIDKDSEILFQYDLNWIKNGFSISPLSLPLCDKIFKSSSIYFEGLFGVFWDCLPGKWGNLLLNRYLVKIGVNPNKIGILTKLTLVAKNGIGGLTFEPSNPFEFTLNNISLDEIEKSIEKILNDESYDDLDVIYALGGSSGGARPKAHIKINDEEWIVKFPSSLDPKEIGFKEFKANKKALDCGINVNEFALFESKIYKGYFAAKRFDRKKGRKVHMISLSSLLETTHRIPNLDYAHLFQVIEAICINKTEDKIEAFKRMCFNVFYGNKDDHGKNFSFIYDETLKGYKLSPAYDLTKTNNIEHEMSVLGNGNPTIEDLIKIGKDFKIPQTDILTIINDIKSKCLN